MTVPNDHVSVFILVITKEPVCADLDLPLLGTVLNPQPDVLRKALTLLLRKRCHDREQDLSFCIQSVDVLLFKEHRYIELLQLSDVFQAVQRVTGESTD